MMKMVGRTWIQAKQEVKCRRERKMTRAKTKDKRQRARAEGKTKSQGKRQKLGVCLQSAICSPAHTEPEVGVPKAKVDVDQGCCH